MSHFELAPQDARALVTRTCRRDVANVPNDPYDSYMSQEIPFAEPGDPRDGPMRGSEPAVVFLLESTRPMAATARRNINEWYSHFPDPSGAFAVRLRSTVDNDHYTALDELFVHELMRRQGLTPSHEEGGVGPDLRAYRGAVCLAGVEVLSLFMRSDWSSGIAQHNRIADELNSRLVPDRWFIQFELKRFSRSPAARRIVRWLDATMASLSPIEDDHPSGVACPIATYEDEAVRLDFTFAPRTPVPAFENERIVGMGPTTGGFVNSAQRLKTALTGKAASRYDLRDQPYAPLVVVRDPFCDIDDIENALYGSDLVVASTLERKRADDGFFGTGPGGRGKNTRISCIFVIHSWNPWEPENVRVLKLENPFAEKHFPDGVLPVTHRFTKTSNEERTRTYGWVPERP